MEPFAGAADRRAMSPKLPRIAAPLLRCLAALMLSAQLGMVWAGTPEADALRARHAALAPQLANNAFQRPIHMESAQASGELRGEVWAVVEHPFQTLHAALKGADRWCDVLILPFNVKQCRAKNLASGWSIELAIGRKYDQPLSDAHRVDFGYRVGAVTADYFQVMLNADEGPMGTRDYRIVFEATPLDERRSFMHMSYSYGFGVAARLAMQGYLGTVGRDKVGFSVVDRAADGRPVYVGSMRGVVERNTMRYYLAIDAYLASLAAPPAERVDRRLRHWFNETERYPRQLREISQGEYIAMKRREIERQDAPVQAKAG